MFLLIGALSRRSDQDQYQELLRSGPFGLGRSGYLIALLLFLVPLICALVIIAITGQQPTHIGPQFP